VSAAAEHALFGDALGCHETLPAVFVDGAAGGDAAALLRALALIEESGEAEREDSDPRGADLARVEAKLDLVLALLGSVLRAQQPELPPAMLRWSRFGACVHAASTPTFDVGRLRVALDPRVPQPLELPARLIACEPEGEGVRLWLRFEHLDPALESALERHVFRRHRRAVAEARRSARA
jgi:hypothetical protein